MGADLATEQETLLEAVRHRIGRIRPPEADGLSRSGGAGRPPAAAA